MEEKEKERTRQDEADEQRREDEIAENEAKQKEKADKEEAEASGTSGASGSTTRGTEIGTDLTGDNIRLYMIRHNRGNQQNYSAPDLKKKI